MSIKTVKSMKLQSLPFHPVLVVFFQILSIYAVNVNTVKIKDVLSVLFVATIFMALLFLLFSFITRDNRRSAIIVTFYCFLFFIYGRLYDLVFGLKIAGLLIGRNTYLIPFYVLTIIAGTFWVFRSRWCKKYLESITFFLNIFSVGLVIAAASAAMTNFDWVTLYWNKHAESKGSSIEKRMHQVSQNRKNILQPNVYFIILDSYANHRTLKKYYDWDDSLAVEAFRARGFSVDRNAYSNYPFTTLSLAATLNMQYIHENRGFKDASNKTAFLKKVIEQNKVMERFKYQGYDVVSNIGDYRFLNKNHGGQKRKDPFISTEFANLVIHASLLCVIEQELNADTMRQDILSHLEDLELFDIPNKPTFVFLHVICPHPPYIFNADGSKPAFYQSAWGKIENKDGYVAQVRFIGTRILKIVDSLRRRDPGAVIVVQADHGHTDILGDYPVDRKRRPMNFLDAKYGILNAMYLPPGIGIPEETTPVNLFRYLFRDLFAAKLEILPDRAFFTANREPYEFFEVTNELNSLKDEHPYFFTESMRFRSSYVAENKPF